MTAHHMTSTHRACQQEDSQYKIKHIMRMWIDSLCLQVFHFISTDSSSEEPISSEMAHRGGKNNAKTFSFSLFTVAATRPRKSTCCKSTTREAQAQ